MNGRVNEKYRQGTKANFVTLCLDALQRGYDRMVSDAQYDVDWEEDNLTVHLIEKIEQTGFLKSKRIEVNPQRPIYTDANIYGGKSPKKAPVVDFKLSKWYSVELMHYYAESKNLSESNWQKSDGSKVNASKYRARYIDTGIENFLSERYPEGCLVGYIVQGNGQNVISGINKLIQSRNLLPRIGLIQKDGDVPFSICHCSSHNIDGRQFAIRHVFLQL